ncbi:hypothetical protein tb265_17520 [Gemmatimonadetes bacterium T265]|nr:hypothetical protein tb265_17520 [Gemmatimonadetes bacterium T265]
MNVRASSDAPANGATARRGPAPLALILQEVLTATVRLRARRQAVTDAAAFRDQIRQLLLAAEQEARRAGYSAEHARLALYAVTALLDESVLNSAQPALADWARQPLQNELFGGHVGGEHFFRQLRQLLAGPDDPASADLLEVYELCLLLGFRGRYGAGDNGDFHGLLAAVDDKIRRARALPDDLSPAWRLPDGERPAAPRDPWARRLALGTAAAAGLAAVLFGAYRVALAGDVRDADAAAAQVAPAAAAASR